MLHLVVFAQKTFVHDYDISEYTSSKNKLELPSLPAHLDESQRNSITPAPFGIRMVETTFCPRLLVVNFNPG
jgi:hypothetical protein